MAEEDISNSCPVESDQLVSAMHPDNNNSNECRIEQPGLPNDKSKIVFLLYISQKTNVKALQDMLRDTCPIGSVQTTETCSGIILSFSHEEDASRLASLDMSSYFGSNVQVTKFSSVDKPFKQALIVRNFPQAIPLVDVTEALRTRGYSCGEIDRIHTGSTTTAHLKIEILDLQQYETLLHSGFNFFNVARFIAVPERMFTAQLQAQKKQRPNSPIQCFRCQGFWHVAANCQHIPRCVRCGDPHTVDYCLRPRNDPICCHCGGGHHAAYRKCPVRMQLMNSTRVTISLLGNSRGSRRIKSQQTPSTLMNTPVHHQEINSNVFKGERSTSCKE